MKTILPIVALALLCGACVKSNGRFGGVMPDGTATSQTAPATADCPPGET